MKKILRLLFERKNRAKEAFAMHEDLREKGREQFKKLVDCGLQVPVALL